MPIFDYSCRSCGHQFELLVLPSSKEAPACPTCGSENLEKELSGFAVKTREMSLARVKKARHQRAASRDFKDRQVAEAEHVKEHVAEYMPPRE
jgi:putative FmdB family regulatory protein